MAEEALGEGGRSLLAYGKPVPVSAQPRQRAADEEPEVQDVLNAVLPPRQFANDKKQIYIERALDTPATSANVLALHAELVERLRKRRAREVGLCPLRRDLYAQCFDELIRQIVIGCTQRGLLLVRVRDEARAVLEAYQQLYESALAYGVRKALRAQRTKADRTAAVEAHTLSVAQLTAEVVTLEEELHNQAAEARSFAARETAVHTEQLSSCALKNQHLKDEIARLLAAEP